MTEVADHRKTLTDRFFKTNWRNLMSEDSSAKNSWTRWPKIIAYRLVRLAGEFTAICLGLACFWFTALNILMARQSVDISGLNPNAQMWFSEAFNGSDAQIGTMKLSWLSASNNFLFEATDVVITDKKGAEIESIESLQTQIPLSAASKGSFLPKHLQITGGTVTWLRDNNGQIIAGLGTPNTVGKLGSVWRSGAKTNRRNANIAAIESIQIRGATAYVIDDSDGVELTFNATDIDFLQTLDAVELDLTSTLQKDTISRPIKLNYKASPDFKDYTVDVVTQGLNPSILSPQRGRYAGLKDFEAELDVKAQLTVDRLKGLTVADLDINVGVGTFKFGDFETEFDAVNFAAVLSPESQNMDITHIGLDSGNLSFTGSGKLSELGAMTDGNINSSPVFDLIFEDVIIDQTPILPAALKFPTVKMEGRLDLDGRQLDLDRLRADLGHYAYDLSGVLSQNPTGDWDNIELKGRAVGTLGPGDILAIWPVKFAEGARSWIERSILKASLNNLIFDGKFGEETLQTGIPKNEELLLTFDVDDADVRYISTMTPYTKVRGQGTLRGNSARFDAVGGNIGTLTVSKASADIPRLQPKGGDLFIKVNGQGTTSEMLRLIDQKPFEYPRQFGVQPDEFGGTGVIDMMITRPLLVNFDRDRIVYDISGKFFDITAPVEFGSHKLKNGHVTLTADKEGMTIKGPVDIGPWKTDLNWRKKFDFGKTPTQYQVVGRMDRETLDGLGFGYREYFDGDIDVKIDAFGNGLDFTAAEVFADLTDTSIYFGDYWQKTKGSKGIFSGQLNRLLDGAIQFEDMTINAPGLDINGRIALAQNFKLLDLELSKANIAGFVDAGIQVKPDELNEKLSIFVTGEFLDVSSFVTRALSSASGGVDVPILLTAGLNKLALSEAYIVDNANLLFSHNGVGITNARLGGDINSDPIKIQMRSFNEGDARKIDINIPDASDAARAFLGLNNTQGGRLDIQAELPPLGQMGPLMGVAEIDEFKLTQAPILAQMLSIASLTGIVDTLSGEGLSFNTFQVPFLLRDGELNIRDARVSGPALGMTGDGEIRFKDRLIDINGALVPAYTANSLLGDIPVIGDIFVGKRGEGIFALSYTVQGEFDETQIAVNPLSALTPGFLRGIFKPKRNDLSDEVLAELKSVRPN